MDVGRCAPGGDTLSGITREAPGGRTDRDGRIGTDRTFGGHRLEVLRYPFMGEASGLGAEGERFTVETGAGLDTTAFGRVVQTSLDPQDGSTASRRGRRGNWRLDRAGAMLLVTDLLADAIRYDDAARAPRLRGDVKTLRPRADRLRATSRKRYTGAPSVRAPFR